MQDSSVDEPIVRGILTVNTAATAYLFAESIKPRTDRLLVAAIQQTSNPPLSKSLITVGRPRLNQIT